MSECGGSIRNVISNFLLFIKFKVRKMGSHGEQMQAVLFRKGVWLEVLMMCLGIPSMMSGGTLMKFYNQT